MWDAVSQIINNSQEGNSKQSSHITKNIRIRFPNHLGSDNFLFSPARIIHCIDDRASQARNTPRNEVVEINSRRYLALRHCTRLAPQFPVFTHARCKLRKAVYVVRFVSGQEAFSSSKVSHFQNETNCKTFRVEMSFSMSNKSFSDQQLSTWPRFDGKMNRLKALTRKQPIYSLHAIIYRSFYTKGAPK